MTIIRTMVSRQSLAVCAGLTLLAVMGCAGDEASEARLAVHPARGQVFYKGKPLPEALVVLRPVEPSNMQSLHQPTGRTDLEGKFQLHTYVGDDGAPAGSYVVGISLAPAFSETRDLMKKETAKPKPTPDVLGSRYADPAKSGLKAEIRPGENEIPPFNLD
jgi:hypothetical protein